MAKCEYEAADYETKWKVLHRLVHEYGRISAEQIDAILCDILEVNLHDLFIHNCRGTPSQLRFYDRYGDERDL